MPISLYLGGWGGGISRWIDPLAHWIEHRKDAVLRDDEHMAGSTLIDSEMRAGQGRRREIEHIRSMATTVLYY